MYKRTDSKYRSRGHYREEMASAKATRQSRPKTAGEIEVDQAMKLYFRDHAAARSRGDRVLPRMVDYVGNDSRHLAATEYAKSRFGELV